MIQLRLLAAVALGVAATTACAMPLKSVAPPSAIIHVGDRDDDDASGSYQVDVRQYGANGKGQRDDTAAFRNAVKAVPVGGVLLIPPGKYRVSDTIVINKAMKISGSGLGSQVFQSATNKSLFRVQNVNGLIFKDLYLGSAGQGAGVSLLELVNSHHNRIDNITMLGGGYGLYLKGSLLNTIVDLRSGTNFQGFFGATSRTQTWVYGEPFNSIAVNANTFIAPVLEGGTNGIIIRDGTGQGSLNVTGGSIEGVSGVGLTLDGTFLPSSLTGIHFEANGGADLIVQNSSNLRVSAILSLTNVQLTGNTKNVTVTDSIIEYMTIEASTHRIRVNNITTGLSAACPHTGITNNNNGVSPYDGSPNVIISMVGINCYNL